MAQIINPLHGTGRVKAGEKRLIDRYAYHLPASVDKNLPILFSGDYCNDTKFS